MACSRADPVVCRCKNACNKSSQGRSKRGVCPCLCRGTMCSDLCTCGHGKLGCQNKSAAGVIRCGNDGGVSLDESYLIAFEDEEEASYVDLNLSDSLQQSAENLLLAKAKKSAGQKRSRSGATKESSSERQRGGCGDEMSMEDMILQLSPDQLRTVVRIACNSSASETVRDVLVSVANGLSTSSPGNPSSDDEPDSTEAEWCKCGQCRAMPTAEERLCCRRTPGLCVTVQDEFRRVSLDRVVLVVAMAYRNELFDLEAEPGNHELRHTAYRQYVLWKYGHLGRGNRVVIPSCAVWKIRRVFPSPNGQYKGYRPSRIM